MAGDGRRRNPDGCGDGEALISVQDQAPWLGEHTREVASRVLGLSEAETQTLIDEEVLEEPTEFKLV